MLGRVQLVPQPPLQEDRPSLRRDAERNRERILAAARRLIAARGLGVGYEEIAREAGVGVGTVYRRFPTRDELFHELFDERVEAIAQLAEEALEIDDPWLGLCQYIERDFELQSSDRGLREFLLSRPGMDTDVGRLARERVVPLLIELIERAKAAGCIRADVGQGDVGVILAMLGSLMDASLDIQSDLWRRYLALALAGIRTGHHQEEIPGDPPSQPQLERILAAWVQPARRRRR